MTEQERAVLQERIADLERQLAEQPQSTPTPAPADPRLAALTDEQILEAIHTGNLPAGWTMTAAPTLPMPTAAPLGMEPEPEREENGLRDLFRYVFPDSTRWTKSEIVRFTVKALNGELT